MLSILMMGVHSTPSTPQLETKILLAGDWNDEPGSELLELMTQYFTVLSSDEATYPADKPTECIDYVAAFNGRAEALESHVIDEPEASDHRPLVVWVRLR